MDKLLVQKIAEFIHSQLKEHAGNEEAIESLEVAKQCLETAYELDLSHQSNGPTLKEIFVAGCESLKFNTDSNSSASNHNPLIDIAKNAPEPSDEDKIRGTELKTKGNDFMSSSRYLEAVDAYSQALEFEPANPVYYGNRAAAYSKLGENDLAVRDCQVALAVDPTYSKAYGRMGLAHAAAGRHKEAVDCYTKGLELDPRNQGYQQNLSIAEKKLAEEQQPHGSGSASGGGLPAGLPPGLASVFSGGLGGMDIGSLLSNPALVNMASQMMQNPQMQQMMGNMMRSMSGGAGSTSSGMPNSADQPQPENLSFLLNAGRNMASQMMADHPDVIEQVRSQNQTTNSSTSQMGSENNVSERKDD